MVLEEGNGVVKKRGGRLHLSDKEFDPKPIEKPMRKYDTKPHCRNCVKVLEVYFYEMCEEHDPRDI